MIVQRDGTHTPSLFDDASSAAGFNNVLAACVTRWRRALPRHRGEEFYLPSLAPLPNQEASMKRCSVRGQSDLFNNATAPPALTGLQGTDELVDLLSRLLWEVVQGAKSQANKEGDHDQDQL
jgi:hypothetical protein